MAFPLELLQVSLSHGVAAFINTDTTLPRHLNAYAFSKGQFVDWGRFLARGRICFINMELEQFYGPDDDDSKFTTYVMRSCVRNDERVKLTLGEQRRDFLYIEDAVDAFLLLVAESPRFSLDVHEFPLGSGKAVTVREFAETVKHLSGSKTCLDFGAIPYRENEVMESRADISRLAALGWMPKWSLSDGIRKTIEIERELMGRGLNL